MRFIFKLIDLKHLLIICNEATGTDYHFGLFLLKFNLLKGTCRVLNKHKRRGQFNAIAFDLDEPKKFVLLNGSNHFGGSCVLNGKIGKPFFIGISDIKTFEC